MDKDNKAFFHAGRVGSLAIVLVLLALLAPPSSAQTNVRKPTLKERLTFGLRARRPSEKSFIDAVVDTVNRGELPLKLVDRTFFWARSRSPRQVRTYQRRPIIYFQPALELQAERLNIAIRANKSTSQP